MALLIGAVVYKSRATLRETQPNGNRLSKLGRNQRRRTTTFMMISTLIFADWHGHAIMEPGILFSRMWLQIWYFQFRFATPLFQYLSIYLSSALIRLAFFAKKNNLRVVSKRCLCPYKCTRPIAKKLCNFRQPDLLHQQRHYAKKCTKIA